MIDYSTQYPWTFGVLSILIATGIHPLVGYPGNFDDGHKIRYRSHNLESLPNPDKVRRVVLSVDPVLTSLPPSSPT